MKTFFWPYFDVGLHIFVCDLGTQIPNCRGGVLEDVLGLEDAFWSPWSWPRRSSPWPRSLKSSKISLSSARGQHYFLNRWNFVGKRQKPRGKFANTFFVFLTWSIGVTKGEGGGQGACPPNWCFTNDKNVTKKVYCFFSFSFFLAFFAYNQRWIPGQKAWGQGHKKKIRGQAQPFRGQTLSRPRTGMLEAKAKDQGHKRKCSPKKKKKVFTKIFQAISTKKRFPKNFSRAPQNFNTSKNSAVLEPRTGQFSRTWGLEAKAKDLTFEAKNVLEDSTSALQQYN